MHRLVAIATSLLVLTGVVIFLAFNGLSQRLLGRWHPSERT